MSEESQSNIHWSFWLIAAFMLLWNVMGCINFIVQMNPEMIASYRENEQAIINGRPLWATVAFAIAVFGGAVGCLMLLLKKSIAYYLFISSLIGVIVTMGHTLGIGIEFAAAEIMGFVLMPVLVAAFLIWYYRLVEKKGWITS